AGRRAAPFLHIGPALVVIVLTTVYPLASALITSFRHWRLNESAEPGRFVGLANYRATFADPNFTNALWVTAVYTVISVVLSVGLGLGMALLLNRPGRLAGTTKALLILPFAVAPALKGFSWRFMLNPDYGVYDKILDTALPFTSDFDWLGSSVGALLVIALTEVWGWAPLIALMLLGGLGAISPEVHEAARVDGASRWQNFRHITWPLLRPLLLIVVFLKAVWSVKTFDQVVTTTGGGPGRSTETLNYFTFQQGFGFLDIGYASAISWVLVVILGVLAALYLRAMAKQEDTA
ncbi:sugar ABC transporter permease, partial [Streptomyces sp. SID3343]|uniref:carbohydrate ABC transporter permease n=1 Tax=Streptomyces sp. SID3343 TaxID=2690260 RepID=UPI0013699AF1